MIAYLQALGHRDPWVTLSLIQSADFKALCKMVGATVEQGQGAGARTSRRKAADSLMNYHHSKRPQQLDLLPVGDKRPLMVIGEMNVSIVGELRLHERRRAAEIKKSTARSCEKMGVCRTIRPSD
jgi:hypothetical protein